MGLSYSQWFDGNIKNIVISLDSFKSIVYHKTKTKQVPSSIDRYINLDYHLDLVRYKASVNQLKSVHLKLRTRFRIPKLHLGAWA